MSHFEVVSLTTELGDWLSSSNLFLSDALDCNVQHLAQQLEWRGIQYDTVLVLGFSSHPVTRCDHFCAFEPTAFIKCEADPLFSSTRSVSITSCLLKDLREAWYNLRRDQALNIHLEFTRCYSASPDHVHSWTSPSRSASQFWNTSSLEIEITPGPSPSPHEPARSIMTPKPTP